jgi:hypothetical protein
VGQDGAAYRSDLGETRSEKYLQMGLDRGIRNETFAINCTLLVIRQIRTTSYDRGQGDDLADVESRLQVCG